MTGDDEEMLEYVGWVRSTLARWWVSGTITDREHSRTNGYIDASWEVGIEAVSPMGDETLLLSDFRVFVAESDRLDARDAS